MPADDGEVVLAQTLAEVGLLIGRVHQALACGQVVDRPTMATEQTQKVGRVQCSESEAVKRGAGAGEAIGAGEANAESGARMMAVGLDVEYATLDCDLRLRPALLQIAGHTGRACTCERNCFIMVACNVLSAPSSCIVIII